MQLIKRQLIKISRFKLPRKVKIYLFILSLCLLSVFILPKFTDNYKCLGTFSWIGEKLYFTFDETLFFESNRNFNISPRDTVYFWVNVDKLAYIKKEIIFGGYLINKKTLSKKQLRYQVKIFEPMPITRDLSMMNKTSIQTIVHYTINSLKYKKDI
jgi:hypothetical protein